MIRSIGRLLAGASLMLKQPLYAFCDIETTHGDALVTKHGDYVTVKRITGMRRMATRDDIARIGRAHRLDLTGALENPGHAIVGWFASDPEMSAVEIDRLNLDSCRAVAKALGLNMDDILDERARLWPKVMRWEAAYYVLWTRKSVLTKEERKQVKDEQDAMAREFHRVGDSQRYYARSEIMSARHNAFVDRVTAALHNSDVGVETLGAHEALKVAREALYRETAGSQWKATLMGDRVMPRLPEENQSFHPEYALWPSIGSQIFYSDAATQGGQRVQIGDYEYAPIDMLLGPEDPRPFVELSAALGRDRIPWRASIVIEGGGRHAMAMKEIGASFLSMFPSNGDLRRSFAFLRREREQNNHIAVKLRASFATWAPIDDRAKLRRRASTLSQRIEGWGNCRATAISGDPLEAAMSSVPALSLSSTGTPSLALLEDAMIMLPWNRTASPWKHGAALFRRPDGAMWPYDPVGGRMRPLVLDIFVAPPGSGKSVLANTINIALCLSSASMNGKIARLPLIGKLDIGPSAQGFVLLMQEALGPARRHEAIFVTMQLGKGYEVNIFDLQVGCEYPLPLERAFLQNFLTLATLPIDSKTPFEGMTQMIGLVIDEAYRLCTDVPNEAAKRYRAGVEPTVDAMLQERKIGFPDADIWWRDVVNALIAVEEYRLAEMAQRHAVPTLQDLVRASRTDQVRDMFAKLKIQATLEDCCSLFERYIYDLIRKYPTLNSPTKLDFGPARIIVMDLAAVAPTGSPAADRQTEMMYMLGRQILARNFFLHPDYAKYVPEPVRAYHSKRFQEIQECVKRLDYDEWHRTEGSPQVRAQAELDVREGRKHNIQLGFSSQRMKDMGEGIASQATGRFILRAGEGEADEIIKRFNLSAASADVIRYRLNGPTKEGAPFLAIFTADGTKYEQMLVNTLGPIELWALSTTPGDTALRSRIYSGVGFSEGLRRLSKVFPAGSAMTEIERRTDERIKRGELATHAEEGVIDTLASELIDGHGIGMQLRDAYNENHNLQLAAD